MPSGRLKSLGAALLAVVGNAIASGFLVPDAAARVAKQDEDDPQPTLLLGHADALPPMIAHRSHSSHRSHRSHRSHYSGSHGSHYSSSGTTGSYTAPKPKKGKVTFVALPGGTIFVDGKEVGRDETKVIVLVPGSHVVLVKNRFLGEHETTIEISDGQTGTVTITW